MQYYKEKSVVKNGAETKSLKIDFQSEITVGTFVDRERPTFLEAMNDRFQKALGNKYVPYPLGPNHPAKSQPLAQASA